MKLTIRCSNGDTFAIDNVDVENTVEEFKQVIANQSNIPASDQRLIYRGKVLKDQATLRSYAVEEGLTIHLVRGKPSSGTSTTATTTTATTTTPPTSTSTPSSTPSNVPPTSTTTPPTNNTSQTNNTQNPFNLFGNLGGNTNTNNNNMFGAGGMPNMDPNMMQQMMNNPFVQSMLNNPDFIREMMGSNPQMQQIMRNNPEVGRMLQDPEMIRRAMEMARNPELMREMMRNTDLAMSNIENLPGGFDALRRMYSDVQEPLHEATSEMFRGSTDTTTQPTTQNTVPSGQPFDMWGNNSTPSTTTTGNNDTNNTNNTTTNTGSNTNNNPFASMFGGMGGMGGMPNLGGMNPQQIQQMMNNPLMQRMMTEMLSDPQMLDQLINSNPMLQQMTQNNPMLRTMMSNPQFMQQVMQLQGMLNQQQQQPGTNTSTTTTGGNQSFPQMPNPFLFGNPWMGGQMPTANTQPTQPPQPPRERFASQLSQLQEMGFFDEQSNIEALLISNGNVNAAIEYLLSNPPPTRNNQQ